MHGWLDNMVSRQRNNGILLINLGTPDDTSKSAIRRYLREFLSDPRVVDIHPVARWVLLNVIILPFRTPKTAHAYQKVWTDEGSPLMVNSNNFTKKLRQENHGMHIELGMRYGNPSIKSALVKLIDAGVEHIKIVPLFPQYASATNGSAIEKTMALLSKRQAIPTFEIIPPFYHDPDYIDALAQSIQPTLDKKQPEHLLLSYHGLPERQLDKLENTECCNKQDTCAIIQARNQFCYRAQCYQTSHLLAKKLNLNQGQYGVSFQSRLGKIPWIKPYTDNRLTELRKQGVQRIAIACPAFVADCLETIEEIGMAAKEQWFESGGKEFTLIPCLNDNPTWVKSFNKIMDVNR